MKKKVKDLTVAECEKVCHAHNWCDISCPLFASNKCMEYSEERYEREVEVDE